MIDGLACYPDNTLRVYNRWGVLVYEKTGYDNGFEGISKGRQRIKAKAKLPSGTYFYVFDYVDSKGGNHTRTGWSYLKRD